MKRLFVVVVGVLLTGCGATASHPAATATLMQSRTRTAESVATPTPTQTTPAGDDCDPPSRDYFARQARYLKATDEFVSGYQLVLSPTHLGGSQYLITGQGIEPGKYEVTQTQSSARPYWDSHGTITVGLDGIVSATVTLRDDLPLCYLVKLLRADGSWYLAPPWQGGR